MAEAHHPTPETLNNRRIYLYGCGRLGKQVHEYLEKRGFGITAFLDQNWQAIGAFKKTPVLSLDAINAEHSRDLVICTILSPYIDNAPVLADLKKRGITLLWTMVDFVSAFPEERVFWYWLAPKTYMERQKENYARLTAMLADEKSRQLAAGIYAFRSNGDCTLLPPSDPKEYFPLDVPRWKNPMRLIDCGAFTGDTIEGLMAEGYQIEEALAFEPDPDNFDKLAAAMKDVNVVNIPCGVSKSLSQFYFDGGMGMGSKMSESGQRLIQCVSISKLAPNFAPNLIKMDIEGAEPEALAGAEDIIRKYTPGLAIAVYHEADHLWKIPFMIAEWNLGYEFYIRSHERNTFGTILYAIREGR